jgi:hypothetical protein
MLQEHGARDDLPLVAHEIFENLKFPWQEFDLSSATTCRPRYEIQFEIADAQHRVFNCGSAAPCQSLKARQEFDERERLYKVVVATGAQATHSVVDFPKRAYDQRRRCNTGVSELSNYAYSVDARQHPIDSHHRIGVRTTQSQAFAAVDRKISLIAACRKEIDELKARFPVILDDKNPAPRSRHDSISRTEKSDTRA